MIPLFVVVVVAVCPQPGRRRWFSATPPLQTQYACSHAHRRYGSFAGLEISKGTTGALSLRVATRPSILGPGKLSACLVCLLRPCVYDVISLHITLLAPGHFSLRNWRLDPVAPVGTVRSGIRDPRGGGGPGLDWTAVAAAAACVPISVNLCCGVTHAHTAAQTHVYPVPETRGALMLSLSASSG